MRCAAKRISRVFENEKAEVSPLSLFFEFFGSKHVIFGYHVLHGKDYDPGFGHSGWGEPHTLQRGLIQTFNNLNALNKFLFELPIPSLIFIFLAFVSLKANTWDLLLIGYASLLILAYFTHKIYRIRHGWSHAKRVKQILKISDALRRKFHGHSREFDPTLF